MDRHVGDHFEGTISATARFGFFVRLDAYDIEGLVHVSRLTGDRYVHDRTKHALRGRRTRRSYRLGDPVEVQVARVDRDARRIDFDLV
ncbi:MAG: S1 RNA-binding domain-containing protein [Gemmatimonadales bacterium]|nr:S1 RNA-binding domain-containing protein [Gemmatimonadales bacterium]